ncbi:MAG: hypothetical protein ACK40O_08085 [Allosphingosinicella sp.]
MDGVDGLAQGGLMHAVHDYGPVLDGLLLTIIIAYLGIALQFWTRRRGTNGRATRALGQLVVIFVFCAICGYLPRLIEIPALPLLAAHAVLAVAAWAYWLTGQVDRLSLAVDHADMEGGEGLKRRSARRRDELNAEIEACARVAEQAGSRMTAAAIRRRLIAAPADAEPAAQEGEPAPPLTPAPGA